MPAPHAESRSPSEVQEIPAKEATRPSEEKARGAPEVPSKRRAGDSIDQKKKSKDSGWHRLPHEADRSASQTTKGKGPAGPTEETPTPRAKPNLPEHALDVPLEIDLAPLTYGDGIWLDGEALTKYIRATHIPKLAFDLYTLSSKVLMDEAPKAMVLVLAAHRLGHRRLNLWPTIFRLNSRKRIDVGSRWRRRKLVESRGRLDDSESQLRNARTQVRQLETELLELTQSKDDLWAKLPRQAIEDYKKPSEFKMGLVRME
ncbi:hypothetical protein B296_00000366 [Ensete ventricosum]|uniref:Uncharacterized protein n=1 Tax=Ensete ventricosum TaxID=4639 RepID=A0A427BBN2_ENSVE|nr:hypothetical protein B296_00000366 [Ensete ventricosum]